MNAVIATFHRVEPARHLQNRLHQSGVHAEIIQEAQRERFQFLSEPLASVHVEVDEDQYLVASQKLAEWEQSDETLHQIVRCPACHCSQIEYPQMTRKFLLPTLGAVLMKMKILPRLYYCCSCHHTWPPKGEAPEEPRDPLGWPEKSKLWHPDQPRE